MEHARITSLNGLMDSVGIQSYIYEDMAEETFNVFRTLSSGTISLTNDSALVTIFNDPNVSDSIVTHFKVEFHLSGVVIEKILTHDSSS
jgi:hypothetical protein